MIDRLVRSWSYQMTLNVSFSWVRFEIITIVDLIFFILGKVIILNCMGSERAISKWSIQFHFWDDTSDRLELLLLSNRKVHSCIYIIQDFLTSLSLPIWLFYSQWYHTQWNTLRPNTLFRPDSDPPEPPIFYPSISISISISNSIPFFHSPLSVFLRAERFRTHNLWSSISISYDRSKHIQIIPYLPHPSKLSVDPMTLPEVHSAWTEERESSCNYHCVSYTKSVPILSLFLDFMTYE